MNEVFRVRRSGFVLLVAALLAGSVSAQPSAVSVVPSLAGPVSISDLRVLLGSDVQFQIFDFEAEDRFCLLVGYVHEIDGQLSSRRSADRGACHEAGPQRLILVSRIAGDKRILSFGLHSRDNGSGTTVVLGQLPIGRDIGGAATSFGSEKTIGAGSETTLMRWRYGFNPPFPGPYHDVHILVRLAENDVGIGTYRKPQDGS